MKNMEVKKSIEHTAAEKEKIVDEAAERLAEIFMAILEEKYAAGKKENGSSTM
jgi:hypothetical protein